MKRYSLSDKVVLITGAGRGLGAATAAALTQRGARVVIADIDLSTAQSVAATLPSGPWSGAAMRRHRPRVGPGIRAPDAGAVRAHRCRDRQRRRPRTWRHIPHTHARPSGRCHVRQRGRSRQHGGGHAGFRDQQPRADRGGEFGVRLYQRGGCHPVRDEQGCGRATRPGPWRRAGEPRSVGHDGVLLTHRDRHDPSGRGRGSTRTRAAVSDAEIHTQANSAADCSGRDRRRAGTAATIRHRPRPLATRRCASRCGRADRRRETRARCRRAASPCAT